jgi:hypothetical protein
MNSQINNGSIWRHSSQNRNYEQVGRTQIIGLSSTAFCGLKIFARLQQMKDRDGAIDWQIH